MSERFNPEMLQLARELRGWTQSELATRSGLTQGYISMLEHGTKEASREKLEVLANTTSFPIEFFFQQETYTGLGLSVFFYRKKASAQVGQIRLLQAEVNLRRIQVARLLRGLEVKTRNTFNAIDIDDNDGDAAAIARMTRANWAIPLGPIRNLVAAIESAGGVVFKFPFGTGDIDAVSMWPAGLPPLFFINSEAPADRIRFSLAHELGHVVMHRATSDTMEEEADRFASEFLMPEREIAPHLAGMNLQRAAALKPYWRVSMASLVRRARDMHRITDATYSQLFRRLSQLGYRKREPGPIPGEEPTFLPALLDMYQTANGFTATDLAKLSCVREEDFTIRFMKQGGLRLAN